MEVTFSLEAFSKIILHVTKYPQYSVNGILLRRSQKSKKSAKASSNAADGVSSADSKVNNGADAETTSTTTKQVQALKYSFTDAIPCLHMNKYVTPMMELALAQIERYCKAENYEIAGYYQANQNLNDNTPDFVAQRIAEKLGEINPGLLVVMVNNDQLNSNLECSPFSVYQLSDSKLKLQDARILLNPDHQGALSTVSALIQSKAYRDLQDFDNHLDNLSVNYWANPDVNERIKQLSS